MLVYVQSLLSQILTDVIYSAHFHDPDNLKYISQQVLQLSLITLNKQFLTYDSVSNPDHFLEDHEPIKPCKDNWLRFQIPLPFRPPQSLKQSIYLSTQAQIQLSDLSLDMSFSNQPVPLDIDSSDNESIRSLRTRKVLKEQKEQYQQIIKDKSQEYRRREKIGPRRIVYDYDGNISYHKINKLNSLSPIQYQSNFHVKDLLTKIKQAKNKSKNTSLKKHKINTIQKDFKEDKKGDKIVQELYFPIDEFQMKEGVKLKYESYIKEGRKMTKQKSRLNKEIQEKKDLQLSKEDYYSLIEEGNFTCFAQNQKLNEQQNNQKVLKMKSIYGNKPQIVIKNREALEKLLNDESTEIVEQQQRRVTEENQYSREYKNPVDVFNKFLLDKSDLGVNSSYLPKLEIKKPWRQQSQKQIFKKINLQDLLRK